MGERRPDDPPPFYEAHVFVCCNRRPDNHPRGSCAARGSEPLRDYLKARAKELGLARVRINAAGCLDRCELGPCIVIYPEGVWYRAATREDVETILQQHLIGGGRAEHLRLPP
jgi:(2Fe-2S) ferredoxin